MLESKSIDFIWLLLILLTLISAAVAESPDQGFILTLVISIAVAFKGRMIIDRFMELKHANRLIRGSMRAYFYVIPLLIILVYLFPEVIVRMTTIR
jgi:cytochrome c oxidase subunit IV